MTEEQIDKIAFYEKQIQENSDASEILKLYRDYRYFVAHIDSKLSLEIAIRGMEFARINGTESEYYDLQYAVANSNVLIEKYDIAFEQYLNCYHFYNKIDNRLMINRVLGSIANIFSILELNHHAFYLYNLLYEKFRIPEDKGFNYTLMINISSIYNHVYQKSMYSLDEYKEIEEYLIDNHKTQTQFYFNLLLSKAHYYKNNHLYTEAIELYQEVINATNKIGFYIILKNAYYGLAIVYKLKGDETEMLSSFKKTIEYAEKSNALGLNQNVYNELYQYYSSKNNYKKALEYLEKYNTMTIQFEESKSKVNTKIQTLGYNTDMIFNSDWIQSLSHEVNINDQYNLYITDINDKIQKVNINDIVFIKKDKEILKIEIVLGKTIYSKLSFKDCIEKLKEIPSVNLFFETNLRNQIVNLFWMVDLDLPNKTIHLKAIDKSYLVQISKRQYALFKKFLQEYFHESNNFLK